jgi:hypothetical protein
MAGIVASARSKAKAAEAANRAANVALRRISAIASGKVVSAKMSVAEAEAALPRATEMAVKARAAAREAKAAVQAARSVTLTLPVTGADRPQVTSPRLRFEQGAVSISPPPTAKELRRRPDLSDERAFTEALHDNGGRRRHRNPGTRARGVGLHHRLRAAPTKAAVRAALLDGLAPDVGTDAQDGGAAAEGDIGWCEVLQALVRAAVVVVLEESGDPRLQVAGRFAPPLEPCRVAASWLACTAISGPAS